LRLGTNEKGAPVLKSNINKRKIKRVFKGYSAGEFDMTQPEWERLDKIHSELEKNTDLSKKEQKFLDIMLARAYARERVV
jgi:ribosome assembly protein YihI (activator of Der GTPase)